MDFLLQIRDLNLGTNFPVIKAVTAKHVNLNPDTSVLEQIDILVEVEYNGGIQLAVDASSRLSKAAMVKIKGKFHFISCPEIGVSNDVCFLWYIFIFSYITCCLCVAPFTILDIFCMWYLVIISIQGIQH